MLEHVDEPQRFLRRIAELLKPKGRLILFAPDADPWSLRWLQGRSVSAWSPEHLILYSRTGIVRVLKETGFRIIRILYNTPVWWVAYNLAILLRPRHLTTAESALLKMGSVCLLPWIWMGQRLGMNEEIVVEAERSDKS
jgi:hypothetical protein